MYFMKNRPATAEESKRARERVRALWWMMFGANVFRDCEIMNSPQPEFELRAEN